MLTAGWQLLLEGSHALKKERGDKLIISLLLVENIHRGDPMGNVEVNTWYISLKVFEASRSGARRASLWCCSAWGSKSGWNLQVQGQNPTNWRLMFSWQSLIKCKRSQRPVDSLKQTWNIRASSGATWGSLGSMACNGGSFESSLIYADREL